MTASVGGERIARTYDIYGMSPGVLVRVPYRQDNELKSCKTCRTLRL